MKICFFAPAQNYHTQKWCKYFLSRGYEVHCVTLIDYEIPGVTVHFIQSADANSGDISKVAYLFKARQVRKIIEQINPDILSVHYATSYGAVAALAHLKGYTLSVWGSDIYEFPLKSFFHKQLLKFSLRKADVLFSTSKAMADEASKYTKKKFEITPFGVDMNLFSPKGRVREDDGKFVIGNIKALIPKYGVDYLLKAAAIVKNTEPDINLEVRIGGTGAFAEEYRKLAGNLGISSLVKWLGYISQKEVAYEWANMDLGIVNSSHISESFGVSAVEAEACGLPVIVTDIPGLKEATLPGVTSEVVPRCNEKALAEAIISLWKNTEKRKTMGIQGRKFVEERYDYLHCFSAIESLLLGNQRNEKI